jgi:hypothetical protein
MATINVAQTANPVVKAEIGMGEELAALPYLIPVKLPVLG